MKTINSKGITEKDFLSQIIDLLKIFQWKYYHVFEQGVYARRTSKGFPDIVAVRKGICLFIELKDDKSKLSPAQEAWGKDLQAVADHSLGMMYFVFRPKDIEPEGGKILEILK